MRKRASKASGTNPNLLPISPKRGLAGGAAPRTDHNTRAGLQQSSLSIDALPKSPNNVTTTSGIPPSSSLRQTRSAKPGNFRSLPDAETIREKRQWTVVRTLNESDDGNTLTVQWKDTVVPGQCIRYDGRGKAFVWADRIRHYIAQRSRGDCDGGGRVMWNCRWEPSDIRKEQLNDLDVQCAASDSESEPEGETMRTPASPSDDEPPSPSRPASPRLSPAGSTQAMENHIHKARGRRSATVSTLTFDNLPQIRPDKLIFGVTSDKADYGPAVHDLIAEQLDKKLATTANNISGVLKRRMKKRRVRPLQFRSWTVNRARHHINLQVTQNAEAALVHMQGKDVVDTCGRCGKGRGVMQGCVVGEEFGEGECTNCHYGGQGNRCNFRKDTNHKDGYRAPRVIKRRSQKAHVLKKSAPPSRHAVVEIPQAPGSATTACSGPVHMTIPGERDFVSDSNRLGSATLNSATSDAFIMSGGLGEMTATPVPKPKQASTRSRSWSSTSSEEDNTPLIKRKKVETIDLTSSPETTKPRKSKPKRSSSPSDMRARKKGKGKAFREHRNAIFTPSSTPPSSPPLPMMPHKSSTRVDLAEDPSARQHVLPTHPKKQALVSPEIATSGTHPTTSTARLKQRKQQGQPTASRPSSAVEKGIDKSHSFPAASRSNRAHPFLRGRQQQVTGSSSRSKSRVRNPKSSSGASSGINSLAGARTADGARQQAEGIAQPGHTSSEVLPHNVAGSKLTTKPADASSSKQKESRSRSPPTTLPSSDEQTTVYKDQRFHRGSLSAWQFSFIWHRCNAETRDLLTRLLRWAWHEDRVPRTTTLADFYSQRDDERGWLNDVVIPKFCPPRPKKVSVIELDPSSDESEGEDEIVLPPGSYDGDWVGLSGSSESSSDSEDSEDDSSDSEESAETGASDESDSSDSDD